MCGNAKLVEIPSCLRWSSSPGSSRLLLLFDFGCVEALCGAFPFVLSVLLLVRLWLRDGLRPLPFSPSVEVELRFLALDLDCGVLLWFREFFDALLERWELFEEERDDLGDLDLVRERPLFAPWSSIMSLARARRRVQVGHQLVDLFGLFLGALLFVRWRLGCVCWLPWLS